jgi:hypothetical protein
MKPKLVFIGAGNITPYHIEAARETNFRLAGIVGRDYSKSALDLSEKYSIPYYEKISHLFDRVKLDCIVLTTPPQETIKFISKFAEMRIPILVEKPVSPLSYLLHDKLHYKNVFVAYNRRFYNTVRELKKVHTQSQGFFHFYVSEVTLNKNNILESIKQSLYTNTVHMFDLIKYIIGDYKLVNLEYHESNHNIVGYIYKNSNFIGILVIAFNSKKNTSIEFENSFLNINISPLERLQKYNELQVIEPSIDSNIRRYIPVWESNGKAIIEEPSNFKPGFLAQYEEFYGVISKEIKNINLASLDDAYDALLKADMIFSKYSQKIKLSQITI